MIEIRGCSKAFGTLMAVSKVSLEIGEREVFGLVGSTLSHTWHFTMPRGIREQENSSYDCRNSET